MSTSPLTDMFAANDCALAMLWVQSKSQVGAAVGFTDDEILQIIKEEVAKHGQNQNNS